MKQNEITVGRFLRIVLFTIVVVAAYFVLNSLSSVLLPFAIAWLLAYMLNPLVNFVQNKMRVKYRALSIVISMLLVVAVLYGLFIPYTRSFHSLLTTPRHFFGIYGCQPPDTRSKSKSMKKR